MGYLMRVQTATGQRHDIHLPDRTDPATVARVLDQLDYRAPELLVWDRDGDLWVFERRNISLLVVLRDPKTDTGTVR